jgi:hypothetical protein
VAKKQNTMYSEAQLSARGWKHDACAISGPSGKVPSRSLRLVKLVCGYSIQMNGSMSAWLAVVFEPELGFGGNIDL